MAEIVKKVFAGLFALGALYALIVGMPEYTPEAYAILFGVLSAVVFEYFPFVASWYETLSPDTKRVVMMATLAVAVFGSLLLSCLGVIVAFACTVLGVMDAAVVYFLAIAANQGAHWVTKR